MAIGRRDGGTLLFAGGQTVTVELTCPRTWETFEDQIVIGTEERFLRIADPWITMPRQGALQAQHEPPSTEGGAETAAAAPAEPPPVATGGTADPEFAEWARMSRQTGIEYCKAMLTASSAAIPVYFAVLQYMNLATVKEHWASRLAAAPAVLFLLAAAAFALAQRPRLVHATAQSFAEVRGDSLRRLGRFSQVGTGLFLLGSLGALIAYSVLAGR
ncbi:hypothetical protein ACFVZ3_24955 [Kitasatospora purpeofusca]|uniref:hypothetical protein n=1 Tax=Kitasatospora purpeofusca TaxID=67352 RepID=UPI0036C93D3C